jgi:hypothetical protein
MIVSDAIKAVAADPQEPITCPVCNEVVEIGQIFKWINKRIYHLACAKTLVS